MTSVEHAKARVQAITRQIEERTTDNPYLEERLKEAEERYRKALSGRTTTDPCNNTGGKHDDGKRRWSLLPWRELGVVVDVLTAGANKYSDFGWQHVPQARTRYFDALLRHVTAWHNGDALDGEDDLPHLAHAACCVLFLLWFDEEGGDH